MKLKIVNSDDSSRVIENPSFDVIKKEIMDYHWNEVQSMVPQVDLSNDRNEFVSISKREGHFSLLVSADRPKDILSFLLSDLFETAEDVKLEKSLELFEILMNSQEGQFFVEANNWLADNS